MNDLPHALDELIQAQIRDDRCFRSAKDQNAHPVSVYELETNWFASATGKGRT
jgi:hypothetical protein